MNSGENRIVRSCKDSMVSSWLTYESKYFELAKEKPRSGNTTVFGFPNNLLIPKGNSDGYACQLFAMVSNDSVSEGQDI